MGTEEWCGKELRGVFDTSGEVASGDSIGRADGLGKEKTPDKTEVGEGGKERRRLDTETGCTDGPATLTPIQCKAVTGV